MGAIAASLSRTGSSIPALSSSLLLAVVVAIAAFELHDGLSEHEHFIAGYLAFEHVPKSRDFVSAVLAIAAFAASWVLISTIHILLERRFGPDVPAALDRMLLLSLLPAAIWLGAIMVGMAGSRLPLGLSAVSIGLAGLFGLLAAWQGRGGAIPADIDVGGALGHSVLVPLLAGTAGFAVYTAAARLFRLRSLSIWHGWRSGSGAPRSS